MFPGLTEGKRVFEKCLLTAAFLALCGMSAAACADDSLRSDLERVAELRVFFGHQSVGNNLLDGVRELAQTQRVPLKVQEVRSAAGVPPGVLAHTYIAANRKPLAKIESFGEAMRRASPKVDIALMKLCYVDFDGGTDAGTLFAKYRETIEALKAKHPGTVFVHVTTPLTIAQTGPKAFIKKLIGRAPYGSVENVRREEYNSLVRQTYQGREPIFDLARLESRDPNGAMVTVEWQGKVVPAMAPAYTDDGGHLNELGRLRIAREFLSVLAGVAAAKASSFSAAR
jgi:hypothetical protein